MATTVTTWGHSCVTFERDGRSLAIDPGTFSDPGALDQRVEAVLITDLELLLLPVAAPWLALGQAIDYLGAAAPRTVVPIHDAILSDPGKQLGDRILGAVPGTTGYRRLGPAERLELGQP